MRKTIPLVLLCVLFAQGVKASIPTSQLINSDGTLNLGTGYSGSLSLTGFEVSLDPCEGPVLRPVPPPTGWNTLGVGLNNAVNAIAISGSNVYVGGEFTQAGGQNANYIAKWDGSSWSTLGAGFNDACYALAARNDTVYAGGFFTTAGGVPANFVAMWNGSAWSAMGAGFNGFCFSLALGSGKRVYAGGIFTQAGNAPANYIATWNGNNWTPLGPGLGNACFSIAVNGADLYAGGFFTSAGNAPAGYIAKWDANGWSTLGAGLSGECLALAYAQGKLYAGGNFLIAGGNVVNRVAVWDGICWSALSTGLNGPCLALAAVGPNLIAGGVFTKTGAQTVNYVAWWDGVAWQPFGTGLDFACTSLAIKDSDVFVGGYFNDAGGLAANFIARYVEPILPVELSAFSASLKNNQVLLEWSTQTETNNYGFYLERSADARQWTTLAFVAGQGVTLVPHDYSYTDKSPLAGVNYYRLRQEDFDGSINYSEVVSATLAEGGATLSVVPNPAGENIRIKLLPATFSGKAGAAFYDVNGKLVYQLSLNFENGLLVAPVDLGNLSKGVYLLSVTTPQDKYSARIVKQ